MPGYLLHLQQLLHVSDYRWATSNKHDDDDSDDERQTLGQKQINEKYSTFTINTSDAGKERQFLKCNNYISVGLNTISLTLTD